MFTINKQTFIHVLTIIMSLLLNLSAAQFCIVSKMPINGKVFSTESSSSDVEIRHGDRIHHGIEYKCNEKYTLTGSSINLCQNGAWTTELPTCELYCRKQSLISIDTVPSSCLYNNETSPRSCKKSVPPATIAYLSCRYGHELKNPAYHRRLTTTCQTDGNWSFKRIRCKPICGLKVKMSKSNRNADFEDLRQLPWHANVYKYNHHQRLWIKNCGGTIITTKFVLSAAHCFWDVSKHEIMEAINFLVSVGKVYHRVHRNQDDNQMQKIGIEKIHHIIEWTEIYYGDLALLYLQKSIVLHSYVRPICIDYSVRFNDIMVPNGWVGETIDCSTGNIDRLGLMQLTTIGPDVCRNQDDEGSLPYDKFCATVNDNTNISDSGKQQMTCGINSGSGFSISKVINNQPRFYLRGVLNAYENMCNFEHKYLCFTNIQLYLNFIKTFVDDS